MKIQSRSVEDFLKNPGPSIAAALFFGPDQGLVRERADRLARAIVDDLSDPFAVVEFAAGTIAGDSARLGDEARSMSLGGGRRLVRVRDAGDSISAALEAYLEHPANEAFIVLEAQDLAPRSSLRRLCERADAAAAVGCYPAEGRDLERLIRESFAERGVECEAAAVGLLAERLANDRALVRQELEKLMLFATAGKPLSVDDVMACLGDTAAASADMLAVATGDGDIGRADAMLQRAWEEGMASVAILRALQRYFQRLDWCCEQMAGGGNAERTVARLKPPVFYKVRPAFEKQVGGWRTPAVRRAMQVLTEAELACKETGAPDQLVCARAVMSICRLAPFRPRGARS